MPRIHRIELDILKPHLPNLLELASDIAALAGETGFEVVDEMTDPRGWFVDSLWRVSKI